MSGAEMMLKSMGLGPALDGVKSLVESGALEKVMKFADGIDAFETRLAKMEKDVADIRRAVVPGADAGTAGGLVADAGTAIATAPATGTD